MNPSLNSWFEELKIFNDVFGFFSNNLLSFLKTELMNHCKNLYLKTKDDFFWWEGTDVSGIDPYNELNDLKLHF